MHNMTDARVRDLGLQVTACLAVLCAAVVLLVALITRQLAVGIGAAAVFGTVAASALGRVSGSQPTPPPAGQGEDVAADVLPEPGK